jgi:D-alanyl-D-alanine endopeptidase (penicillin-binding protein 7)
MGNRSIALGIIAVVSLLATAESSAHAKKRKKRVAARTPSISPLTRDGMPNVQSASALVLDLDDGSLVFGKNPDEMRAIASTGKIFVAMAVRKHGIELDGITEISEIDQRFSKGGAHSRLLVGHKFKNGDLLRAMLISSDNRACTALGRAVGLTPEKLIDEMNTVARELGLTRTHFTDPTGLRGNESTAREMTAALQAALRDPLIAEIMATPEAMVVSQDAKPVSISYRNTNHSLRSNRYTVMGGKTGYTEEAGYCLIVAARIAGRNLVMAFLGSHGKETRFGDFGRVAGWLNRDTRATNSRP